MDDEPSTSADSCPNEQDSPKSSTKNSSRLRRVHNRQKRHENSIDLSQEFCSSEKLFPANDVPLDKVYNLKNRSRPLWLIGFVSCILLMLLCYSSLTAYLWRNDVVHKTTHGRTKTSLRTVYSGVEAHEGQLFTLNRHEFRRKRSIRDHGDSSHVGQVYGLARECGRHCSIRLKAGEKNEEIRVRFSRFKLTQKHPHHKKNEHHKTRHFEASKVVPLVQYMDSEDQTHARLSKVSPDCIYSAHVNGTGEKSIVNLCDRHRGLFGTLALQDGAYVIEPLDHAHLVKQEDMDHPETSPEEVQHNRVRRSFDIRPHLVYKTKDRIFEKPIRSSDSSESQEVPFQERKYSASYDEPFTSEELDPESYVNATEWEDIKIRQERSRRSANSWDHYVEVLVVADYKMLLYHQGDLESYILTLFSTVASIYRHPTLRASINIIVVRILILKSERAGPLISNRAQETLQNFCAWQQNYNDRNDDAINHHDVAILITRHDICRATNKCDTLGLAELGTMCDSQRSCAIIEDNGLSAAFTIAHELGHIFNIPHDDERKCGTYMALNKHNYHIMAPTLEYNTHPWSWSACSSAMLSKFLDQNRAQTQCILDQPVERRYYDKMFENPAPGAKYSVNQQCQFVFGSSAEICPYMPTCRRLWCSTYYGYQMGCRTQHMPWADGTPCGDNMWCHRGQCVGMSPMQREKQDGAWGEWKAWGDCSRTCGGGVQKALRDCDSPRPMNGGKYCVGQRERYRPCNIQECPWDTPGFREDQCSEFDNRDVGIHGVSPSTKWVPKYAGISENERCKLYCRAKDSAAFYLLREKVLDGTPCDRNGDDICIDGTCHKAGCDHRLGSEMKRDVCGICGGDSSSCQTVEGTYNERVSFGYNEVLKIPAGSANIDITQKAHNRNKDDDNYLALRSANGEFILNGQYQVSVFRQQISIQDMVLEYSGSDQELERINGSGPIRSDIYLHVLCVGNLYPPNIHYKYMVPRSADYRHVQQHHATSFYWRISDHWTECSAKCQGSQKQQLICVDALSNRQVNERHCTGRRPDIQQRMCNVDCFAKWQTKEISGCSARCGRGEKHQRSNCVLSYSNGREEQVSDQECMAAGLARPPDRTTCYSDCSGRKWAYSEWTPCTETCGTSGMSRRNAYCIDDSNRHIDIRHCESIPRDIIETECNRTPCPKWVYGHWSECSRSCDGGIRIRHASCQNAAGQDIKHSFCSQAEKQDREKCNDHVCTQWKFGPWSTCSATCGAGVEIRSAQCVDREGRILGDDRCDYRERIVQKQCLQPDCPTWKLGSWSACSVSCMDGWNSRLVMCVDANGQKLPDEKCMKKGEAKPPSHQPCNYGPCPFWRPTEWSKCSVTCGAGIRQREVECVYRDQIVDASLCPEAQKPKLQEPCTLLSCAFWDVLPWSSCSVSCGAGFQRRIVQCVRGSNKVVVGDRECQEEKPKTERSCERDACPGQKLEIYWATGPWSECSQSCGNGTQRRIVVCHDHIRELGNEYCTQVEKPPNTRECSIRSCAEWRVGPWLPCPATCGIHHVQRRRVSCEPVVNSNRLGRRDVDNNLIAFELPETDCDPATQPEAVRNCGLKPCPVELKPVYGNWTTSEWTECSTSCGSGWRRRKVHCSLDLCIESEKPPVMEQCNKGECQKASWQITPWSSCSVTCGNGGYQERTVWCQTDINGGQKVNESECLRDEKKPITRRGCALPTCVKTSNILINPVAKTNSIDADNYTWQSGKWSTCSTTCGRGLRKRTVECIDPYGKPTSDEKCDQSQKPTEQQKCRLGHCPRWHKGKWSTCSATCGNGVKRRTVFCKKGKHQRVADTECHKIAKPQETSVCQVGKCPVYYWKVTPWSKCTDPCKPSDQHRRVYCMSALHQRAAPRMCANETEPITKRKCPIDKCPYEWVPGPWSTCSRTCGKGFHFRRIDCKVKRSMRDPNSTSKYDPGSEPTVLSRMCMSLPKPEVNKECAMNPCDAPYRWSVLPWSPCSKSCGPGYRRRKTPCLDQFGNRVSRNNCDANTRPSHREPCFLRNCLPNDCAEIKAQNTLTHSIDGNYTVLVAGFRISVYCHLMNETIPKTYINVRPDSNFAEFYGKRLKYPYTCPFEGRRNDSCVCTNDGHVNLGFTRFKKLRVDLHNMKINPHDFTFADTLHGTPVPYGTAGDCYSMSDCPQGTFSIDLRHTGLRIVDDLQWVDHGHRTNSRIERTENNAFVRGYCGGYCGECAPDRFKGLVIEVDQKQKPSVGVG